MYRRFTAVFLFIILIGFTGVPAQAAVSTPSRAGAIWATKFSDPYFMGTSMTSTPVVTEDTVYVVNRDTLYALNSSDGTIRWELDLAARMNSVCDPALSGDNLYIPLSDGVLQCIDLRTHTSRWISEKQLPPGGKSAQTLGRLTLSGGYLYAGVWVAGAGANTDTDIRSDGVFFCIDAKDGHTVWQYRDEETPIGFYWTHAVAIRDRVFFTEEDGTLISHSPTGSSVFEKLELTDHGQLRCGLCSDTATDTIYTVSKDGNLIRIRLESDGRIRTMDKAPLISEATVNCTSTPTLYRGRLYIGCIADGYGWICIVDAESLKTIYRAKGPRYGEIKSRPLVIPDTELKTSGDAISVYVTANESNGALYVLRDSWQSSSGKLQTLFTPYQAKQYCLANAVAGPDGTLYYSNDSGTLFAIGETPISADLPEEEKNKRKKVLQAVMNGIQQAWIRLMLGQKQSNLTKHPE